MTRQLIRGERWEAIWAPLLALIMGGFIGSFLTFQIVRISSEGTVPLFIASENNRMMNQVSFAGGFAPVVKSAVPAVVNISSSRIDRSPDRGSSSPFFSDPFFRDFFGDQFGHFFDIPRERRAQSLGSGVIISPEGYVLTNDHVVNGATDIKIYLSDKREFKARIVGRDPKTDLAVLKLEQKNLPVLTFGDSSKVEVGDFALAIGNPFGIGQTVTMGIVGATGRGGFGIEDYEDFIQTDAAINPGNSGGALINVRGELIGINTAIITRSGGNQGIGFAVPINMARSVMEQILKKGKVIRGWLGITIQDVTPTLAKSFGLGEAKGALVGDVTPDGPAARSGLTTGDVILEVNGENVPDSRSLRLKIGQLVPGTKVQLKLWRDGKEREVSVVLGEMPAEEQRRPEGERSRALEGIEVDELTPQVAQRLGVPRTTRGVVVVEVSLGSPAAEAGLRRGDIIQEVNRRPVASVAEFERAVRQSGNESVLVLVNRSGSTLFLVIEMQ
ncbi:MAG TPA: DegQ family serine endoprotease [Terriglobia bacterium]|nr:DegQ family serine endoprotease [Terriglobia bacterium]